MNLPSIFQEWKRQLQSLLGHMAGRRPQGILLQPNQMSTVRGGRFSPSAINWEKIYRKSFLYNSLAIIISAYFVADFLVLAVQPYFPEITPPRPRFQQAGEDRSFQRYQPILARNLFNERGLIPNLDVGDGIDGPPVRTNLPLTLLGVIVVKDPQKSVASVDDKGANQVWAVRPGESMGPNIQVQAVEFDRMIFINKSERRREFVELPKDLIVLSRKASPARPGGISNEGNHYNIDRKEIDKVMANFNEVLTQARCLPNMEAGKPAGYRCFQIEKDSIYDKLGMKDDDVICGINGQPVNDPATAFNMLETFKTAPRIELCIKRGNKTMNLVYDIN